jgi:hypothetical protein
MGLTKRFILISLLFLLTFYSLAATTPSNPNPQIGDLYGYANGRQAPIVTSLTVNNCLGTGAKSLAECRVVMATKTLEYIEAYGDQVTTKAIPRDSISYTQSATALNSTQSLFIQRNFNDGRGWLNWDISFNSQYAAISTVELPQCPPVGYLNFNAVGLLADVLYCFDPIQLDNDDTCESSDDFYPSAGLNGVACVEKNDGSRCEYHKSPLGDYHEKQDANFCYQRVDFQMWAPLASTTPPIDPTLQTPQDVGAGIDAFAENPENVCDTNGNCNTGCGTINSGGVQSFVCLSPDSDLDGIADYVDPDIDGDGIRNSDDLDPDGDGQDNPVYQNAGSGSGTSNELLESLANASNSIATESGNKLGSLLSEMQEANGSGLMPAFSEGLGVDDANTLAYSTIANSQLVQALNAVSGAIQLGAPSCPVFAFYLPSPIFQEVSTRIHCDIMPTLSTIIRPVMMAIYLFLGFRVFTSA